MLLFYLLFIYLFIFFLCVSTDIKVSARIPSEAEVGEHVEMECRWDIYGGKSLYSVKWYKDGHEFFRYVPDNVQPLQTFNQPGVKLDVSIVNYII